MSSNLTRRWAVALAVAALVAIVAVGATRSAQVEASAPARVQADSLYTIPLPQEVRAFMLTHGEAQHQSPQAVAPGSPQQTTITVEQFEGTTFPPDGWEVVDRLAGQGEPAQWTWGRETCEVPTQNGGQAAAWGVGGGAQGSQLPCWTPYTQAVDGLLMYGGIDTTGFPGGIQVSFLFEPDIPRNNAFNICWALSAEADATCRSYNVPPEQMNRWLQPSDPVLPDTAGASDLVVFFRYVDDNPNGTSRGAIIDNVLIEGLTQEATETPTRVPTTPRPTRTPTAVVTPHTGRDIFLPLSAKNIAMEDLPTAEPGPSWHVTAEMGTTDDQGNFTPGTLFPLGTMGLCLHVAWEDMPIGTQIRWQWYSDEEPIAPDNTDLNQTIAVDSEAGDDFSCIQYSNSQTGDRYPLPEATYSADVWVDQVEEGDPVFARAAAVVGTPPPTERTLVAEMGTLDEAGQTFTPGTMYQSGLMGLCLRVSWWNQPIGTEVRWLWFADDEPIQPDDTDLNPTFQFETARGTRYSCIQANNPDTGARIPLPDATFRVDVWMDQVAEGDPVYTSATAVVGEEGTPPPMTATPQATREPGTYTCREAMVNGDFEQGPDVGWAVDSNVAVDGEPLAPQHLILSNDDFPDSDPAYQGQWFARLGDDPDFDMNMALYQATPVPMLDAGTIISAQLQYYVAYVTDEVKDGTANDIFGAILISQDNDATLIDGTRFSEEGPLDANQWYRVRVDVTQLFTARAGWTSGRVGFASNLNSTAGTVQLLDASTLTICEANSAVLRRPASPSGIAITPVSGPPTLRGVLQSVLPRVRSVTAGGPESHLLRSSAGVLVR